MKKHETARRTISVDGRVEDILRALQGRLIIRTKEDWSYTDVVNFLLYCGLREFHRLNQAEQEAWLTSFAEQKLKPDIEGVIDDIINRIGGKSEGGIYKRKGAT